MPFTNIHHKPARTEELGLLSLSRPDPAFYLASIRRDINSYVLPRTVTEQQAQAIKAHVQGTGQITVKVNSQDSEAFQFASQLSNALTRTQWQVEFSSDAPPLPNGDGLHSLLLGSNSSPDQHDPGKELQSLVAAFRKADILVDGGGTVGAGEYKMFLMVGHRPVRIYRLPAHWKIGLRRWLDSVLLR